MARPFSPRRDLRLSGLVALPDACRLQPQPGLQIKQECRFRIETDLCFMAGFHLIRALQLDDQTAAIACRCIGEGRAAQIFHHVDRDRQTHLAG